jgi:hypothetical protein
MYDLSGFGYNLRINRHGNRLELRGYFQTTGNAIIFFPEEISSATENEEWDNVK